MSSSGTITIQSPGAGHDGNRYREPIINENREGGKRFFLFFFRKRLLFGFRCVNISFGTFKEPKGR